MAVTSHHLLQSNDRSSPTLTMCRPLPIPAAFQVRYGRRYRSSSINSEKAPISRIPSNKSKMTEMLPFLPA